MRKNKVRVCQNLGTISKAQRLLWKCEQERGRLKRLYVDTQIELIRTERNLKTEMYRTGFYHDCIEFIYMILIEAKELNKEEISGRLKDYIKFRESVFTRFLDRCERIDKIEISAFGKNIVSHASNEKTLRRDLKEVNAMLKKEKALSSYLYDCKEVLIKSLCDVSNKCPQTDSIRKDFRQFDKEAIKRLEEKIKAIKNG